jgi:hypothetical protein
MRTRDLRRPILVLVAVLGTLVGITVYLNHSPSPPTVHPPLIGQPGPTPTTSPSLPRTSTPPKSTRPPMQSTFEPTTHTSTPGWTSDTAHVHTRITADHGQSSGSTPRHETPATTRTTTRPTGHREQGGNHRGSSTFADTKAQAPGPRDVAYGEVVTVSCKVFDPSIESANPDGYWYRIASAPWNDRYYAVANTFTNGDVLGDPNGQHHTDPAVPTCT